MALVTQWGHAMCGWDWRWSLEPISWRLFSTGSYFGRISLEAQHHKKLEESSTQISCHLPGARNVERNINNATERRRECCCHRVLVMAPAASYQMTPAAASQQLPRSDVARMLRNPAGPYQARLRNAHFVQHPQCRKKDCSQLHLRLKSGPKLKQSDSPLHTYYLASSFQKDGWGMCDMLSQSILRPASGQVFSHNHFGTTCQVDDNIKGFCLCV